MKITMEGINDILKDKLQNLVLFLCQITEGFETLAEDIECTNLRTAILAVSVESKQYAEEISNQLHEFNIAASLRGTGELWDRIETNIHEEAEFSKGGEIVALCNNCENYFNTLYEDILKEYFPFKKFKDIIIYQLYATQCAFMKIRLLNSLRFTNKVTAN
jgi:hypothetical protein